MIAVRSYPQLEYAISALQTVKSYILAQENVNDDILYCIPGLEIFCSSHKGNSMKQAKITDFLK
jgi:hypothetical protein